VEPLDEPRVLSGRYEITHLIARGGMAQIYRAHDRQLDRIVALKVLFPELSTDRSFVERFRREAQAAANLSHPNIVQVYDWGEDEGNYFIVMELVEGQSLSEIIRDHGPLKAIPAARIAADIAAGLAYAHRSGVVHRDVKPGNVIVTADGEVKVTDFGIARAMNTDEDLTQTGLVMGTATYFSPEQAEGRTVDGRSDLYALGVVAFEMVAGRPPFVAESPIAVASKHVREVPPLPRDFVANVPPDYEAVVMKSLSKFPEQRYQTADEMRADFLRFVDGQPVLAQEVATTMAAAVAATTTVAAVGPSTTAVPAYAGPKSEYRRERSPRAWIAAIAALVLLLAVIGFFLAKSFGGGSGTLSMPNVVGISITQARIELSNAGLEVARTTQKASKKPVGTVLSSNPASGLKVQKGQKVTLEISKGGAGQIVEVPNVVNQDLSSAETMLQQVGLTYVISYSTQTTSLSGANSTGNSIAQGKVLSQDPPAKSKVTTGTQVTLTVPQPTQTATVPGVVGQTASGASGAITGANLIVGTQGSKCSNSQPKGIVLSSSPAEGTEVATGTAVNFVVSTGSCSVVIQNVVGLTQSAATITLQGQGLVVQSAVATSGCMPTTTTTSSTKPTTPTTMPTGEAKGSVASQTPVGGTASHAGVVVTIYVCP